MSLRKIAAGLPWFVAGAFLILTMLHVVANALTRTIFGAPLWGTNEIVSFWYMPLLALIGFVLAQARNDQVEARLLFDHLPRGAQLGLQCFAYLLTIALCAGFAWYTTLDALKAHRLELTGGVIGLTIWPVTFAVPAVFAAMGLLGLRDLVRVVRARTLPDEWRGHDDPLEGELP